MFVVKKSGLLSLTVLEGSQGKKFKVLIGERNSCSCKNKTARLQNSAESIDESRDNPQDSICIHILFVLLKVFGLSPLNPIVWQLGLIEPEITSLLNGKARWDYREMCSPQREKETKPATERKLLSEDDTCPICYEEMQKDEFLVWCRKSCGHNIHFKCMKIWAAHRENKQHSKVTCPLCRIEWDSMDLRRPRKRKEKTHSSLKQPCSRCKIQLKDGDRLYKCGTCQDFFLCCTCFATPAIHSSHDFCERIHLSDGKIRWKFAERSPPSVDLTVGGSGHVVAPKSNSEVSKCSGNSVQDKDVEIQSSKMRTLGTVSGRAANSRSNFQVIGCSLKGSAGQPNLNNQKTDIMRDKDTYSRGRVLRGSATPHKLNRITKTGNETVSLEAVGSKWRNVDYCSTKTSLKQTSSPIIQGIETRTIH